tara:strand:+ start:1820 stop:2902 length:1083 start_codon:yes stop_codon:yes gene_type:complete
MKKIITTLLLVFIQMSLYAQKPEIVGGTAVTNGDYKFMATLLAPNSGGATNLENNFFCGASLIGPEWVLTAAHCLIDYSSPTPQAISVNDVEVGFNIYALENPNGNWVHRTVDMIIIHPDFLDGTDENADVALIKLSQPVVGIKPVALPSDANDTLHETVGTMLRSIGFGANQDPNVVPNFHQSDTLLFVDVSVISVDSAKSLHPDYSDLNGRALPTLGPNASQDKSPCFGDSGGPLFNEHGLDPVQVGVVSWGVFCGDANYAAVFARVSQQISWIKSHITDLSAKTETEIQLGYIAERKLFLNHEVEEVELKIFDGLGRLILDKSLNNRIEDLSFLKAGYYTLSIKNNGIQNRIKYVAP